MVYAVVYFYYGFIVYLFVSKCIHTNEKPTSARDYLSNMTRTTDKQNDIIHAAIGEFADKGMSGTTMEAIAKRANVSKRTLYKHYPCKSTLLDVVITQLFERIASLKTITYNKNIPVVEQLKQLALLTINLMSDEDHLTLSRIVIRESIQSKESATQVNTKFTNCEKELQTWFKQASEAGALGGTDPTIASQLFYGSIKKLAFWEQIISWKPAVNEEQALTIINETCEFFEKAFLYEQNRTS